MEKWRGRAARGAAKLKDIMKTRKPIIRADERRKLLDSWMTVLALYTNHEVQPERKPPGTAGPATAARPMLIQRSA